MEQAGIEIHTNVPHASEQNLVERGHGVIIDGGRSMLSHARLPKRFLGYAILTARNITNIYPHPHDGTTTPHETLKQSKPEISCLRVFGSDAYAHIHRQKRSKADAAGKRYIFVGYSEHQKGYNLYDPETQQITVHRDVIFNEQSFGGRTEADAFSDSLEDDNISEAYASDADETTDRDNDDDTNDLIRGQSDDDSDTDGLCPTSGDSALNGGRERASVNEEPIITEADAPRHINAGLNDN